MPVRLVYENGYSFRIARTSDRRLCNRDPILGTRRRRGERALSYHHAIFGLGGGGGNGL
jgi:hypothetical protein